VLILAKAEYKSAWS